MKILMLDRSIGFDPTDISVRPLGARQRGFIALAEAFAARGDEVVARRFDGAYVRHNGVTWGQLDDAVPPFGDALPDRILAWRDPGLLDDRPVASDGQRWLWYDGDVRKLDENAARMSLLMSHARLIFTDTAQQDRYNNDLGFIPRMVAPGACPSFVAAGNRHIAIADRVPVAVTVTGWKDGLDHLIRIWCDALPAREDDMQLEIYSAVLFDALKGEETRLPDALVDLAREAISHGVRVRMPLCETDMAEKIASARAFLHYGKGSGARDHAGTWLCDALAAGTPVVSFGGIAHARVENGRTGYIVPDDAAYGNLTAQLLKDNGFFAGQSEAARARHREWLNVAADLEKL
jgi:glycosyltransferase involved in cell wall biosynthesis